MSVHASLGLHPFCDILKQLFSSRFSSCASLSRMCTLLFNTSFYVCQFRISEYMGLSHDLFPPLSSFSLDGIMASTQGEYFYRIDTTALVSLIASHNLGMPVQLICLSSPKDFSLSRIMNIALQHCHISIFRLVFCVVYRCVLSAEHCLGEYLVCVLLTLTNIYIFKSHGRGFLVLSLLDINFASL